MTFAAAVPEEEALSGGAMDASEALMKQLRLSPAWIEERRDEWGERLIVAEWEDDSTKSDDASGYRKKNGWQGRDLVHDKRAPVRVTEYFVNYGHGVGLAEEVKKGGVGTELTGIVIFTERAESHAGFCHGGSMCSVLDDVIGWCAFLVTGVCRPWSGFTVQINTSLKKPVKVNSTLLVRATITSIERRKVSIQAELVDPTDDSIHATGDGLVVMNRGVLPGLQTQSSLESLPSM